MAALEKEDPQQYVTPANLEARIRLVRDFGVRNGPDYHRWQFDHLQLPPGGSLLEEGAGTGLIWSKNRDLIDPTWHMVLSDGSEGMVRTVRERLPGVGVLAVADIATLPFVSESFDVVVAHHVLYHVDPLATGVAELARVLRPGGRLQAATSGRIHMRRLSNLAGRVSPRWRDVDPIAAFSLETAKDTLEGSFVDVAVTRLGGEIVVPETDPVMAYVESLLSSSERTAGSATLQNIARELEDEIAESGSIRIKTESGIVIARKA